MSKSDRNSGKCPTMKAQCRKSFGSNWSAWSQPRRCPSEQHYQPDCSVERIAPAAANFKPCVQVIVDGETKEAAYQTQLGVSYPAAPSTLPHDVLFYLVVDPAPAVLD